MANFVYQPTQNMMNMDPNNIYGSKTINLDQQYHYNHMGAMDCKMPQQNYNMANQYAGFYAQPETTQNYNINHVIQEEKQDAHFYGSKLLNNVQQHSGTNVRETYFSDVIAKEKDILEKNSLEIVAKEKDNTQNTVKNHVTKVKLPVKKSQQFKKLDGLFNCDLCDYSSRKVSSVKSHRMIHTGERPFTCDLCTKSFRQKEHLKNHRLTHTREKLFFCNECPYSCGVRGSMDLHKLIHRGIKPYVCTKCDYRCRRPFEMKKHRAKCESVIRKCDSCDKTFSKKSALAVHRIMHLDYLQFACRLCEYTAKLRSRFKSHLEKMHPEKTFFICQSCDFSCTKKRLFKEHKLSHDDKRKWFKCDGCEYSSSTKSALKEHVITCMEDDAQQEQALDLDQKDLLDQSSQETKSEQKLSAKEKQMDDDKLDGKIENTILSQQFDNNEGTHKNNQFDNGVKVGILTDGNLVNECNTELNQIELQESVIKSVNCLFYCDICEFSSRRLSSVRVHKYLHTGERPFLCDVCPASYTRRQHLQKHKTLHAKGKDAKLAKSMKIYTCNACSFSCAHKGNLQKHQLLHAAKDPNSENHGIVRTKKFPCNICKLKFSQESQMVKHLKSHIEKAHTGGFVYDASSSKSLLDQYNEFSQLNSIIRQGDDTGERYKDICTKDGEMYCCNLCEFATKRLSSIRVHYLIHTGETPYKCDLCTASYRRKQHLQNHRIRHLKETIYLCHLCDFTSSLKSSMEVHRKTHDDAKIFVCDKCDFSCGDSLELEEHKETCVHLICSLCADVFMDQVSLEEHERSHGDGGDKVAIKRDSYFDGDDEDVDSDFETLKKLSKNCRNNDKVVRIFKPEEESEDESKSDTDPLSKLKAKVKLETIAKLSDYSGNNDDMDDRLGDFNVNSSCDEDEHPTANKDGIIRIRPDEESEDDSKSDTDPLSKLKVKVKLRTAAKLSDFSGNKDEMDDFNEDSSCNEDEQRANKDVSLEKEEEHCNSDSDGSIKNSHSKRRSKEDHKMRKFKRNQRKRVDGLYLCDFCNYSNKRLNSVKVHTMIHTGERPFLCDVCSATFRQKEHLINHKNTHTTDKTFFCEECGFTSKRKVGLLKHQLLHKEKSFVCTKCGYRCRVKSVLEKHEMKCKDTVIKCNMCDETFAVQSELVNHRSVHIELKTYTCELCDFTATNLLYLKKHTLKHSKVLYLCYVCSFTTVHKTLMQNHRLKHNEKIGLKAEAVNVSCNQGREHPEEVPYNLSERKGLETQSEMLPLPLHPEQGIRDMAFDYRIQDYRNASKMDAGNIFKPFFPPPANMHQEKKQQPGRPKKYKTGEFKKENDLYFCDFCDYSNTRVNSVKVHRMIHTDERPFSCDLCPKSFRQKMHLRNHKITHTKEKLFFCNECNFSCGYKASLDLHKLKHTGVRPYVCERCLYSCRRPVEMERHEKVCGVLKNN